jgi:hypothetical protein
MCIFNAYSQDNATSLNHIKYIIQTDSTFVQEEVCAILTHDQEFAVAWIDRKVGTEEKHISYTISYDKGEKWRPIKTYNPKDYLWTGNPALAEDDNGNIYLIAMSNNYDGKNLPNNGIFEISKTNNGGESWSKWTTVVKSTIEFKDIPDKPTLIAKGNGELYLSYINFNSDKENILNSKGDVIFIKSKDAGKTWSDKMLIDNNRKWKASSMLKAIISGGADFGEQGPSLAFQKDKILLSYGSYSGNGIWLAKSLDDGNSFEKIMKIAETKTATPITKLFIQVEKIGIVWYDAHDVGKGYYMQSSNGGKEFSKPIVLSKNASLVSGSYDQDGGFHVIWNEASDEKVDTKYSYFNNKSELTYSLFSKNQEPSIFYIGAYQEIIIDKNGVKHAFWIDWSQKGGKLIYSKWN